MSEERADGGRAAAGTDGATGRVIRAQSGFYEVDTGNGTVTAVLRGRIKKARRESGLVALGDEVSYERLHQPEGDSGRVEAVITGITERRSALIRRAPGPKGAWAQNVIVANIDQLVTVLAARHPAPRFDMLDRFLALAETDGIEPVIVLNKVELGVPAEVDAALGTYDRIGYAVLRTSAETGAGLDALRAVLAERTSAVVGPSGVGKSSLLNLVAPGFGLPVGAVGTSDHQGRHTTRVGRLLPLPGGGWVADTPGLREIGMWEVDPGELDWAFVEFRAYRGDCRFYDCTHVHEPGCAIRAAVDAGTIAADRYASYLRMLDDEG